MPRDSDLIGLGKGKGSDIFKHSLSECNIQLGLRTTALGHSFFFFFFFLWLYSWHMGAPRPGIESVNLSGSHNPGFFNSLCWAGIEPVLLQ